MSGRTMLVSASVVAMVAAGAWSHAQVQPPPQTPSQVQTIVSGSDLGFRIARRNGDKVVGSLVVRINGQWLDVENPTGLKPVALK